MMRSSQNHGFRIGSVALALALAFVLGACGGGGSGGGKTVTATGGVVTVTTPSGTAFDVATIKAKPGDLTVTYVNHGNAPHDFSVHGLRTVASALAGETASATFTLEAGKTYTFFCSLFSHEAQGMKGTIVVE
jgi:plastocyanin